MKHLIKFEIKGTRDQAALIAAALATYLINLDGHKALEGFTKDDFITVSIEEYNETDASRVN